MMTEEEDWTLIFPEDEDWMMTPEGDDVPTPPIWMNCLTCDGFVCTLHDTHTDLCPCPPIEFWIVSPYLPPPPEGTRLHAEMPDESEMPGIVSRQTLTRYAYRWLAIGITTAWAWRELAFGSSGAGMILAVVAVYIVASMDQEG